MAMLIWGKHFFEYPCKIRSPHSFTRNSQKVHILKALYSQC